jgi:hypothetical protein
MITLIGFALILIGLVGAITTRDYDPKPNKGFKRLMHLADKAGKK